MKYSAASIALFVTLAILVGQSECTVDAVIERIPSEIVQHIVKAKDGLINYNFTSDTPKAEVIFNLISPEHLYADNGSLVNKTLDASTVHVVFDLVLADININGRLNAAEYRDYRYKWYKADFRSLGVEGNLTIKLDVYFNRKSQALIIKDNVKYNAKYVTDYFWYDCDPKDNKSCGAGEDHVDSLLANKLPEQFKARVHKAIFLAVPEISKKLAEQDARSELWRVMRGE